MISTTANQEPGILRCLADKYGHPHWERPLDNCSVGRDRVQHLRALTNTAMSQRILPGNMCLTRQRRVRSGSAPSSLHCPQNLGRRLHLVSFLSKSDLPPEPLSKRLYSAKISRALWLVSFSRKRNGVGLTIPIIALDSRGLTKGIILKMVEPFAIPAAIGVEVPRPQGQEPAAAPPRFCRTRTYYDSPNETERNRFNYNYVVSDGGSVQHYGA